MEHIFFILISMGVAALIGGITNHLAIKMLFHPRVPWRIGRYRVPFTPGLIPKRKEEIGKSLGKVVADYLVTSQGLVNLLKKPEFRAQLEVKLTNFVLDWTSREETLQELLLRLWNEDQIQQGKAQLVRRSEAFTEKGIAWLWENQGWSTKTVKQLLPNWSEEKREALSEWGSAYLIEEVKKEMLAPGNELLLKRLVNQTMDQAGGLLGTLAGLFMDEDKMLQKVKTVILERLDSPTVRNAIAQFINKKLGEWEEMSLSELLEKVVKRDGMEWITDNVMRLFTWDTWLERAASLRLSELLAPYREWIIGKIPWVHGFILQVMESNVERIVAAVQLPKLVEEQVGQFPIDRLEDIILSVSGKEFRAITWLGALLGGLIGFVQSLIMLWYM